LNAGDLHRLWRDLPLVSPDVVLRGKPILVLSPHPDDETLGVGGLIAAACDGGIPVQVAVISDGSQSHPRSQRYPRDRLVALRRDEVHAAGRLLGLDAADISFMGLPDAAVPLAGAAFESAVDRLVDLADRSRAETVFVTWGGDPHCDHEAVSAMAGALCRRRPALACWSYPIWGWHLEPSTPVSTSALEGFRVDIAPWLSRKRRAIAAHASQISDLIDDDPEGFRFTPETLAPFLSPFEVLFAMQT
jgi:LmbE family N-acetylglucosaminyl deacetylase